MKRNSKTSLDEYILKALSLVNSDDYKGAKKILCDILSKEEHSNHLSCDDLQAIADIYLALGEFDSAYSFYLKVDNKTSAAFVKLVTGDLAQAESLLKTVEKSSASLWCKYLTHVFLEKKITFKNPTFLQIRHYLEMTVYYLLIAKNRKFADLILAKSEKLCEFNADSEKYIGSAFYHAGDLRKAEEIFNMARQNNPFDGEIYYYLGKIFYDRKDYLNALSMLSNANLLMPEHKPTTHLIDTIRAYAN